MKSVNGSLGVGGLSEVAKAEAVTGTGGDITHDDVGGHRTESGELHNPQMITRHEIYTKMLEV